MSSRRALQLIVFIFSTLFILSCGYRENSTPRKTASQTDKKLEAKVIYGGDDRKELYEVNDLVIKKLADSTVALIENSNITQYSNYTQISGDDFSKAYNLCPSEPYGNQKLAAFCSGFLVDKNTIVTAGHCIRSRSDCLATKFVFNYSINSPNHNPMEVSNSDVYTCKNIIKTAVNSDGSDFAIIELDRTVTGHQPLLLRKSGTLNNGAPLVVIGHPVGLPKKVAGGAIVRKQENTFFTANLDTYGGNSGSAVFNAISGEVEGILVRGATDFKYKDRCVVSNNCSDTGTDCNGEDVTKISQVLPYLPSKNTVTNTFGTN